MRAVVIRTELETNDVLVHCGKSIYKTFVHRKKMHLL